MVLAWEISDFPNDRPETAIASPILPNPAKPNIYRRVNFILINLIEWESD